MTQATHINSFHDILSRVLRIDIESMRAFVTAMLRLYAESPPALLFLSDNIRRFWPELPAKLRRFTLVKVAREILAPGVRGPGQRSPVAWAQNAVRAV